MDKNNSDLLTFISDLQDNLVILLNFKGKIIKFNKACEKVTGYSFSEVKNKKIWEVLIKQDEIEETKKVFNNLKAKNFPIENENYLITKDGNLKLISWTNIVLLDEDDEVEYIVAIGRDITEKKWNEKILKKSQEIANIGNWVFDLRNNSLFWSDGIYRIFGLKSQEFGATYEAFLDMVHPEDRQKVDQAYNSSIENDKDKYEIEHRIIKQDNGEIRYVKEKCEHIKNDNGEIVRSLGIVQDITDRKKAEEKLRYSRERYQTIFNSAPIGKIIEDDQGNIIEVNEEMCKMSGYRKEELEGSNIIDKLVLPEYQELAMKNIQKLINGETLEYDIKTPTKKGKMRFYHLKETNIDLPNGEKGILSMHMDITEQKKLEKNLKEKNKLFNGVLESIQDGITVLNPNLTIEYINSTMEKWYEDKLPLIGQKCYKGYYDQENECNGCPVVESLKSGEMESIIKKLPDAFDLDFIEIFSYPIWDEDEKSITGVVEFVRDITERKKQQEKIKTQKDRMKYILEGTDAGTWEWNIQTGETKFNETWSEMIGYTLEEISPTTIETWKKFTHPDDLKKAEKMLEKHFSGEIDQYKVEIRMKHKKGHWIWVLDQGKVVSWTDDGKPLRMFGVHIDITARKKREEKIKKLTFKDHLTGLYNRRYLDKEIERINYSRKYPVSVIIGDLDKLKYVNDNFGHKIGDEYIKKSSEIFKNIFRTEEIIARTGGDEFALLLTETDEKDTKKICKRIREEFKKVNDKEDLPYPLNISLGSDTVNNKENIYKCYERADHNMYKNKDDRKVTMS